MNGYEHSMDALAVQAVALGAMPDSPIRDAAMAKVFDAVDLTLAGAPNQSVHMNEAESTMLLLALRQYNGKPIG